MPRVFCSARVMVAVAEAYLSGQKVLSPQQVADRFDLSPDVVERLARRLKEADLLIEVEGDYSGFMPARPPAEIKLAQVLAAFRTSDREDRGTRGQSGLDAVLGEIESGAMARAADVSLGDLVEPRPA